MREIYKTGYGWISPRGNVFGCDRYGHFEAIAEWADIKELLPQVFGMLESLVFSRESCEESCAAGEHPSWHCYEMACDRQEPKIKAALLSAGFIRIGTSPYAKMVEAEGNPEAILSRMTTIKRILKEYNAEHRVDYQLRIHSAKK